MKKYLEKGLFVIAILAVATYAAGPGLVTPTLAASGAIWTTTGSCGDPQNKNHYNVGDVIFINGAGFDEGNYNWSIEGKPGGASADPGIVVASGSKDIDASGSFCFNAYTVAGDDRGEYQVKFDGAKGDNYRVQGEEEVPEPLYSLHGYKWNDLNGNGFRDDEPLLAGWTIFIDENGDGIKDVGEVSMVTDDGEHFGWYWFEGLPAGNYEICEVLQPGWDQIYPSQSVCHTTSVPDGEGTCWGDQQFRAAIVVQNAVNSNVLCNFGNQEIPPICGDGIVNQVTEQCDGTAGVGEHQACTRTCTLENVPYCGDGIVNQTSEQCDGTAGVGANQTCTTQCTLQNNPVPVITIEKLDTPDPVAAGANITYTINWTVSNVSATNVVITDSIPANTSFVSASTPGTYDAVANKVTWNMGTVAPGNYVTQMVVKVNSPLANGTKINNTATIDSTETDPANGVAQTTVSSGPILAVEKAVDLTTVNPGQTVNYTVKVTNSGTDTAYNVKLTDTLPSGFATPTGETTVTHSFGNIAAGATVSTTFAVVVGATNAAGEYVNIVRVNSDNYKEISAQVALNVIVPVVLGEQTEETPVPQVLGDSITLPVTGNNIFSSSLIVGAFLAGILGLGLYMKPRLATVRKTKSTK